MLRPRSGFTLIELLVVIAIIGILVGLLLPAVQRVREAAARMKCENNLKQLAIATHSYHDANSRFPPGRAPGISLSAHAYLLPYIEQENLYKNINFAAAWDDPLNDFPRAQEVPTFRCPSDPRHDVPAGWAGNNYRVCQGSEILWGVPSASGPNSVMPAPNGIFFVGSKMRFADITDGTSNTALWSEHLIGDFSNAISTDNGDTYWPKTYPDTPDGAVLDCASLDITDLQYQRVSDVGAPWLRGYHSTTIYFHVGLPNTRSCMFPSGRIATTANSAHPGGVNVALADGSVRFFSNNISLETWRALGSRCCGEVLGSDY